VDWIHLALDGEQWRGIVEYVNDYQPVIKVSLPIDVSSLTASLRTCFVGHP
jgi:hypothetical protein